MILISTITCHKICCEIYSRDTGKYGLTSVNGPLDAIVQELHEWTVQVWHNLPVRARARRPEEPGREEPRRQGLGRGRGGLGRERGHPRLQPHEEDRGGQGQHIAQPDELPEVRFLNRLLRLIFDWGILVRFFPSGKPEGQSVRPWVFFCAGLRGSSSGGIRGSSETRPATKTGARRRRPTRQRPPWPNAASAVGKASLPRRRRRACFPQAEDIEAKE